MDRELDRIPMIRALKHYPDDPKEALKPRRLRDDFMIRFVTSRDRVIPANPLPGDCLDHCRAYSVSPLFLAELRNGAVLRKGSYIFTERNELLRESVDRLAYIEKVFASHPHLATELEATPPEPSPEAVTVLGAQRGANYFHWWIDVLAKCWMIQQSPYRGIRFVGPPHTHEFQRESLRLLGQDFVAISQPLQRFQRIVFTRGLTFGSSQAIAPQVVDFARWCREMLDLPPPQGSRKLFLSRARARDRRLLNEKNVLTALGADFEVVELEALSVQDQASLFSQASMVVAPHGAGLTNLLFCPRPTAVVELVHRDNPPNTYRRLASLLGHPYIAIGSDPVHRARAKPSNRHMTASPAAIAVAAACLQHSNRPTR